MIASAIARRVSRLARAACRAREASSGISRSPKHSAREKKRSAISRDPSRSSFLRTSYATIEGKKMSAEPSRHCANSAAFFPALKYSIHPEESTTKRSEALGVVTVFILPLHAFGDAAQLLDRARPMQAHDAIEEIDLQ